MPEPGLDALHGLAVPDEQTACQITDRAGVRDDTTAIAIDD
jgi:hypothetical protein